MEENKIFLDSSVIVSSLISKQGGSFYIINTLNKRFELQTNKYALREVEKAVNTKFESDSTLIFHFSLFLNTPNISTINNPSSKEKDTVAEYISVKDAPILASAIKHSDYLITLDKEFFKDRVIKFANKHSLTILTPKDFIEKFRDFR